MRDFDRVVITGPSGWIGRAAMAWLNRCYGAAWRERVVLFGSRARSIQGPDGDVAVRALEEITAADVENALVLHLAYLTKDKVSAVSDADFFAANLAIDDALLTALRAGRPRGVFVASSGAAADVERGRSRNLYGVTKLLQEERFGVYGRGSDASVLIGRIFNIAGPYINKLSEYAIGSFITQALQHGRIEIVAAIPVYRTYLHVDDLLDIVIGTLSSGAAPAGAIDLCGPLVVEMQDVAEAAIDALGLDRGVISRPPVDFARASMYLGDPCGARSLALANGSSLRDFATQVRDTIEYIRAAPG